MNDNSNLNIADSHVDEIDLVKIFKILLHGKLTIFSFTTFFAIAAVVYSLYLPNIYQSEALLSPVGSEIGANQSQSNIGGIANLAGINLSSQSGSNSAKAIKKLSTLSFFEESILPNIFLPDLMAMKSWDEGTNTIVYNENLFNTNTQTWTEMPSPQESFKIFQRILEVSQERDSDFVTIAIKHKSPHLAQEWTNLVVNEINDYFRVNDKREAEAAMDFLNLQIALTSYTEIKQVIAQLLQKRMQQLTLIEANEFYVFSYLDPPVVMEEKIQPDRKSICILGTLLGALLGIFIVLIREFLITKNSYKE